MSTSLVDKIRVLAKEQNAVILAHNYQIPEVQDIADVSGDSLGLSIQAAETQADTIVFCGVRFMAETAKILSPGKRVLLPTEDAGCPMAQMITGEQLAEFKAKHPGALVVCYVNTTAEVKAQSDYCCTSGNALELVQSLPEDKPILFVPDKNLGGYINEKTDRNMVLWPGYCSSHTCILLEDVQDSRVVYPEAVLLAHPECNKEVRDAADFVLSTGGMLAHVRESDRSQFLIATEEGILHTLKKQNPHKEFHAVSPRAICPNMKKINLEKILWSLESGEHEITLDEEVMKNARLSLDRMLGVLPGKGPSVQKK